MKSLFIFCILFLSVLGHKQTTILNLSLKHDSNYDKNEFKAESDSAILISAEVFNSQEFKEDISKQTFVFHNHCIDCQTLDHSSKVRIKGDEVLQRLFKKPTESLSLKLEPGETHGPLGETCPEWENKAHETTTYYNAINNNMPELNFKYRLAVNICHEYMHLIGYCHPDKIGPEPNNGQNPAPAAYKNDIAYRVGWTAYYILLKRQQSETHPSSKNR